MPNRGSSFDYTCRDLPRWYGDFERYRTGRYGYLLWYRLRGIGYSVGQPVHGYHRCYRCQWFADQRRFDRHINLCVQHTGYTICICDPEPVPCRSGLSSVPGHADQCSCNSGCKCRCEPNRMFWCCNYCRCLLGYGSRHCLYLDKQYNIHRTGCQRNG